MHCIADHGAAAQGPCPNCNTENFTYFGDIFTVKGNREENTMDCRECKAKLTFKAEERAVRALHALGASPSRALCHNPPRRPCTGALHCQQCAQLCALAAWDDGFSALQWPSSGPLSLLLFSLLFAKAYAQGCGLPVPAV